MLDDLPNYSPDQPIKRVLLISWLLISELPLASAAPLDFEIRLETVIEHDDRKFLWYHPRPVSIPSPSRKQPTVLLTLQKHLNVSDYYSGLYSLVRDGSSGKWSGPTAIPQLDWRTNFDGVTLAVADVNNKVAKN